jgi:hypothetical protein
VCDYCDCRSLAPIAALSEDHEALGGASARVRSAIEQADYVTARREFASFAGDLRAHMATEEHGLFTELRLDASLAPAVDALEQDHTAMRVAFAELDALVDDPAWASRATRVLDDLAAHIWVEEYDVFPASIVGVTPTGWDRLVTEMQET